MARNMPLTIFQVPSLRRERYKKNRAAEIRRTSRITLQSRSALNSLSKETRVSNSGVLPKEPFQRKW